MQEDIPLHDREKTSVEACRIGYAAFRRGIGGDAHLNICGGHYLAGIGIQDSARNGSDTYGRWVEGGMAERVLHGVRRAYQGRWWNADPDGMAFRQAATDAETDCVTKLEADGKVLAVTLTNANSKEVECSLAF